MNEKRFKSRNEAIENLREMYILWDGYLKGVGEEGGKRLIYGIRSIKDDVAHLWAWQRISLERMMAAAERRDPVYGWVPKEFLPHVDNYTREFNEFLYFSNRNLEWNTAYEGWRSNFMQLLKVTRLFSDDWLFEQGKYEWLGKHRLVEVLDGTYNHHAEHWGYHQVDETSSRDLFQGQT